MRRLSLSFLLLIFVLPWPAAADEGHEHAGKKEEPKFSRHYKNSFFEISENRRFSLELVFEDGPLAKGPNNFHVLLHDDHGGDVADANLAMKTWMPDQGGTQAGAPTIERKKAGLYKITNLRLPEAGHWKMEIGIEYKGLRDRGMFDFVDVPADAQRKPEHGFY